MVSARSTETHDVRGAVLRAATRLFAAHGFDGTTLQDVADVVGVSKPAVLHHFASKELLRNAVLGGILAHWGEAMPRLLLAASASEDRFDSVLCELHRFFAADPDRALVILRETLDRTGDARRVLDASVRPWVGAIAGYIRSGQESGRHYADVDPEAYVVHVAQLVVVAFATASVTRHLVGADAGGRYERELTRIAKAALFAPDRAADGARAPAREKTREPRAKRAAPSKAATSKAATSKAATSKAATSKAATSKAAASKAATSKAATSKATASKVTTSRARTPMLTTSRATTSKATPSKATTSSGAANTTPLPRRTERGKTRARA
jgi:AcrR family transcriptional regulator